MVKVGLSWFMSSLSRIFEWCAKITCQTFHFSYLFGLIKVSYTYDGHSKYGGQVSYTADFLGYFRSDTRWVLSLKIHAHLRDKNTHYRLKVRVRALMSAPFQTNQVERENHKPRPTSIQCSSIIFMHFLLFAKLGRVKLQGFTDLLAPIKTDSNHSWTSSNLLSLFKTTIFQRQKFTVNELETRTWSAKNLTKWQIGWFLTFSIVQKFQNWIQFYALNLYEFESWARLFDFRSSLMIQMFKVRTLSSNIPKLIKS